MLWSAKYAYDYLWSKQERKLLVRVKQLGSSLLCDPSKKKEKKNMCGS